jgi:hypothetical protein
MVLREQYVFCEGSFSNGSKLVDFSRILRRIDAEPRYWEQLQLSLQSESRKLSSSVFSLFSNAVVPQWSVLAVLS